MKILLKENNQAEWDNSIRNAGLVYSLMYFRAKCLLKVIFLFIPIWNIVVIIKSMKND